MSKIVLCVDDSATMQQVADITFRGTEFTYVGARNFDEGLEKARSQKPTVILADSHMPGAGKSGYDLCFALKSDAGTASIPVAILIGNAAPYDATRGVQVGADANLPKPWDTQTMLEKVTEIVGKAASGVARPGQSAGVAPAGAPATGPITAPQAGKPVSAAAAAASASMPPRSATIMGMPTIKMPAGNAPPAPAPAAAAMAPAPAPPPPTKTSVMAVPPISPGGGGPGTSPSIRSPAPPPPASAVASGASAAMHRAPLVAGAPTKRSLLVERTLAKMAARLAEATGLEPGSPELAALLKLSAEVVERVVWEVVPDLAEQIIRENLHDLTARRS
ncbi:MAG TPA: response regulator [Kofleriaceae bacterium]|nr:response regulator [Kofleriaceae bacterium]